MQIRLIKYWEELRSSYASHMPQKKDQKDVHERSMEAMNPDNK
jgi:hypothetical protein